MKRNILNPKTITLVVEVVVEVSYFLLNLFRNKKAQKDESEWY